MSAGVRFDLLKEAAAIARIPCPAGFRPESGGRSVAGRGIVTGFEYTPLLGCSPVSRPIRALCRRVADILAGGSAAYTISDEQLRTIKELGLSDAELFDLTLATLLFSSLAIVEPISAAVAPIPIAAV